jgi:uncharacterized membrane protein YphA (DoxX/SURF4 family)
MKTAVFGRIVFGAAAVLYGVIALMWHDADTWQTMFKFLSLPSGAIIGNCLMVAQIIGGVAMFFPGTARGASIILGIVYLLFSAVAVPGIIASPATFEPYGGFFEQFSLLCGAVALYAATVTNRPRAAAVGRAARYGLGLCAVSFTLAQIFYLHFTASLVPAWIPPNQMFWAVLTTIAFALAAIAMLVNVQARLAVRLMTLMLALFGILVWVPALVTHPEQHGNWSEFALNFQITGAAWMVAVLKSL